VRLAALGLFFVSLTSGATIRVTVDVSDNPNAAPYIGPVKALFEKWYPAINSELFGKNTPPLPFPQIHVIFERMIERDTDSGKQPIPAYAHDDTVHVNFAYLGMMPDDYQAMLIHELAHVNQHYKNGGNPNWLTEGIADYIRHKYFEKDIQPKLEPEQIQAERAKLEKQGYRLGYTVTGAFLFWLEQSKDKELVPALNHALRDGTYSDKLFEDHCHATLDSLWDEFFRLSAGGA
jgi:hypothetical protein